MVAITVNGHKKILHIAPQTSRKLRHANTNIVLYKYQSALNAATGWRGIDNEQIRAGSSRGNPLLMGVYGVADIRNLPAMSVLGNFCLSVDFLRLSV